MDVLTSEQRRTNMSRIRSKDTAPELLLRRGLHAAGLRFRLHVRDLPGRPDVVFPAHRAAVFVHGCFGMAMTARCSMAQETALEMLRVRCLGMTADGSPLKKQ